MILCYLAKQLRRFFPFDILIIKTWLSCFGWNFIHIFIHAPWGTSLLPLQVRVYDVIDDISVLVDLSDQPVSETSLYILQMHTGSIANIHGSRNYLDIQIS